jgi:hypothetical protein
MSKLILERVNNPPFATLGIQVPVPHSITLKEVARMYSWCSMNSTKWNLRVDSSNNKTFKVTFAFENEMEALIFKLTWACS